ncbi:MAG: sugar phosphate isomerase/epimerase family protein [Bacteroidales bacterium]
MERRSFIKNGLLTAGALSLGSPLMSHAGASQQDSPFKKSIMWGTVNMPGTVLEKCVAIKAAGFHGVEFNSHMNREEAIKSAKEAGLEISSVCNAKHWALPLSHADAEIRRQGAEAMIVAMEDAKAYGTDAVLLVPGVVNNTISYKACWDRSTEQIKELVPVAEKLKVKICIENVWNNFLLSPLEAANYVDQFKSDMVGFYFDAGNILAYGWPEQWIETLGKRMFRLHIKEFSKKIADTQGKGAGFGVKLTEGDNDWNAIMAAVREVGYGPWLTTEQRGGDSLEGLIDLNRRLTNIINI